MDFLDQCESLAHLTERETALREQLAAAQAVGDVDALVQLARELDAVTTEKQIAFTQAIKIAQVVFASPVW